MTGTPSKDRAEAIAREFAYYTDRSRWGSLHLVHQERLAEVLAETIDAAFAEGMKRAAEIARQAQIEAEENEEPGDDDWFTRMAANGQATVIASRILSEIGEV